jgi:membrane associated rhomboid family serine protease
MGNYYRYRPSSMGFGGFTLTPAVKVLLIVNAILYIVPALAGANLGATKLVLLWLIPAAVLRYGMIWQVFTYMFFHGGFTHFLFNMLTLWMFGTPVEQTWGTRRFTSYYLLCGVAAGVCVVAAAALTGAGLFSATIGSSGAIFGLILAFGMLFPDTPVYFMFLFPLPAKYFVMLMAGIEFFLQWAQPGSPVSHLCHLGGLLFGFLYIRLWLRRRRAVRPSYSSFGEPEKPPLIERIRRDYRTWRLRRARKKFEVYMHDQERPDERENKDRWVH